MLGTRCHKPRLLLFRLFEPALTGIAGVPSPGHDLLRLQLNARWFPAVAGVVKNTKNATRMIRVDSRRAVLMSPSSLAIPALPAIRERVFHLS